ncbi:MAG: helix-turn-helix domain-containing protein [Acidobacteriota bacterium]|nr:helix-turn-helix domain-containing protein [Acidobacteriota bacterium]
MSWKRIGFRLYGRWRCRPRGGRPRITEQIRVLIRRLVQENRDWGAPKIHGELEKLGFVVSEMTVARYLRRIQRRAIRANGGLRFFATTARRLSPSTSSRYRRRRPGCCTASSGASTDAAGSGTSTSPITPRLSG